jgi:hypothetical protein
MAKRNDACDGDRRGARQLAAWIDQHLGLLRGLADLRELGPDAEEAVAAVLEVRELKTTVLSWQLWEALAALRARPGGGAHGGNPLQQDRPRSTGAVGEHTDRPRPGGVGRLDPTIHRHGVARAPESGSQERALRRSQRRRMARPCGVGVPGCRLAGSSKGTAL